MNPVRERGRTFALDMGSDGAASLQKVILKKLTEFMGDYTDDVLAQYILVLVAHGKQEAQAVKDLEAFLGDQSESFVSWLWDYLCSNLHLHAPVSKASFTVSGGVLEQEIGETDKNAQAHVQASLAKQKHVEPKNLRKHSSGPRNLPDLNAPPPKIGNPEYGSESDTLERNGRHRSRHPAKRQRSPVDALTHKERKKASDAKHHHKGHSSPQRVNATRRLLQSAVREAVAPTANLTKSGSKRLRSVVSTEVEHAVVPEDANKSPEYKDVVKVDDVRQGRRGMSTVLEDVKAFATLSENAMTMKGGMVGSVWDRLGVEAKKEEFQCETNSYVSWIDDVRGQDEVDWAHQDGVTSLRLSAGETCNKGIANVRKGGQRNTNTRNGIQNHQTRSTESLEKPREAQHRIVETGLKEPQKAPTTQPPSSQPIPSSKHVVCSQGPAPGASKTELSHTQAAKIESDSHKSFLELKRRIDHIQKEMIKLRTRQSEANKDLQNTSCPTISGTEQVQDSQNRLHRRTVFVTNIHFAATKESISAHFAQCGKVEQVVVLTDTPTGKPKGSAYVEFSTQDEADKALALNETSFYSRILKVVLKNPSETTPVQSSSTGHSNSSPLKAATRGRFFKGSVHALPRFPSMHGPFVAPMKMQWKRDATGSGESSNPPLANGNKLPVRSTAHSFTYVRNPSVSRVNEGMIEGERGTS